MISKSLDGTSEKVPSIGMGTWKVGSASSESKRHEELAALKRGIELGMALIDTAEIYGDGKAERLVGEAIRGVRDSVFLVTKVWPDHFRHDDVISACDGSLQRLGVKYVDIYLLHWPNPQIPIKETMSAMETLVRDGKTRYIGVSNFSVAQTEEARGALPKSELVTNQVEYSLSARDVEGDVIPYCEKEKLTAMAYSPLGRGRLASAKMPQSVLTKYSITPVQAALAWVTKRDSVIAIPKASSVEHTEENAAAGSIRLSDQDYRAISEAVR